MGKLMKLIGKLKSIDSWEDLKYKVRANIRTKITERGYPERHRVTKAPRYIHIEINNTCNLKCIMCSYRNMERKKQYVNMSMFKKVIDDCKRSGIEYIRLFAIGEPLMHPKLFEMIKYAKTHGIGFVDLNSNGNLLTEEKAKEMLNSGLCRVVFSVDGSTEETYQKIRLGGSLKQVKKNISYLIELRKKLKKRKPYIVVQTMHMKETENEIDDAVKYWKGVVDDVGVYEVENQGGQVPERGKPKKNRDPCLLLWRMMTVCPNGDVSACCADTDIRLKIGNVNESSLSSIWHGERLNWMRKMHLERKFNAMPLCGECSFTIS